MNLLKGKAGAKKRSELLRADYRKAFRQWASQVARLHVAQDSGPGAGAVADAREQTRKAETAYREARDRMADDMLSEDK